VVRPNRWDTRAIMRQNCESQAHDFYPTEKIGYDAPAVRRPHDGPRLPTICRRIWARRGGHRHAICYLL